MYQRDDIYFCSCCNQFFDITTDNDVDILYSEMPAEFAIELMSRRALMSNVKHETKRKKRKKFIDL